MSSYATNRLSSINYAHTGIRLRNESTRIVSNRWKQCAEQIFSQKVNRLFLRCLLSRIFVNLSNNPACSRRACHRCDKCAMMTDWLVMSQLKSCVWLSQQCVSFTPRTYSAHMLMTFSSFEDVYLHGKRRFGQHFLQAWTTLRSGSTMLLGVD